MMSEEDINSESVIESEDFIGAVDFDKLIETEGGERVVPVAVVDRLGKLAMVGFMNEDALRKTIETGLATFWSRSRQELWTKGETSGNTLPVDKMILDCDNDTILLVANPQGPVCHRKTETCFDETIEFVINDQ